SPRPGLATINNARPPHPWVPPGALRHGTCGSGVAARWHIGPSRFLRGLRDQSPMMPPGTCMTGNRVMGPGLFPGFWPVSSTKRAKRALTFLSALRKSDHHREPFDYWLLEDILPKAVCDAIAFRSRLPTTQSSMAVAKPTIRRGLFHVRQPAAVLGL